MIRPLLAVVVTAAAARVVAGPFGVDVVVLVALTVVVIVAIPPRTKAPRVESASVAPAADPPSLRDIASSLIWATVSGRHFDQATRPMLREVTAHRLRKTTGVDLDTQPVRARELLGERVWPLVDPGRVVSPDGSSPGVDLRLIDVLLDRLEGL
jgi:hypothetical protein